MMKFFPIILSSLILIQSLDISVEDISKLNVLLEHAKYHQENYGDSFFEFLSEHYGEEITEDTSNNHKEHKDLPFKHDNNTSNNLNWTISLNGVFLIKSTPVLESSNSNFFYKESTSIFEKQSVFQPPKFS